MCLPRILIFILRFLTWVIKNPINLYTIIILYNILRVCINRHIFNYMIKGNIMILPPLRPPGSVNCSCLRRSRSHTFRPGRCHFRINFRHRFLEVIFLDFSSMFDSFFDVFCSSFLHQFSGHFFEDVLYHFGIFFNCTNLEIIKKLLVFIHYFALGLFCR